MPQLSPSSASAGLLLRLLQSSPGTPQSATHLARLEPDLLGYLQIKAADLHHRAVDEARDLLDVALELLEQPLSTEQQRRLIERADDELASAQRWGELAANARFCLQRPELAQQLADDARAPSSDDATGNGEKPSRERQRSAR
ncbi:MAG: hypothetical protein ACREP7_14685 [Lysobacter sp.]